MRSLNNIKDIESFDVFEIRNGNLKAIEGGYYVGETITENPKEVARCVKYLDAEVEVSAFNGELEHDIDVINLMFEESRQYIDDVTAEDMVKTANSYLKKGYKIARMTDINLPEGNYIDIIN